MKSNTSMAKYLLDRAHQVSGDPTKKAAVTKLPEEGVARRQRRREYGASFDLYSPTESTHDAGQSHSALLGYLSTFCRCRYQRSMMIASAVTR